MTGALYASGQDLANVAWALAALGLQNIPLLSAISSSAQPRMSALEPQNLANTAWAFATRQVKDKPLLNAIAEAAI